jgi:hypothetical protein
MKNSENIQIYDDIDSRNLALIYIVYHLKTLFSGIGVENPTFVTKIKISLVRPNTKFVCFMSRS